MLLAQGPLHHGRATLPGPASRTLASARLGELPADADHLVQRRNGDELAFEDVAAPLGLAQQVLGAPADHLDAMAQELLAASA